MQDSWFDSASRSPFDHLLDFAQLLRERGNDRYRERQYGSAYNIYNSALLALIEWNHIQDQQRSKTLMESSKFGHYVQFAASKYR